MRVGGYQYPLWLKRAIRPAVLLVRYAGLRTEDAILASFPRSGSTWLRFLLLESLTGNTAEWNDVNRLIPYVGGQRSIPALLPGDGRLVSTHDPRTGPCRRAVLLVRDPRDVVLSYYRWLSLHGYSHDLETFLPAFLDGRLTFHGAWSDNTRYWLDSASHRGGRRLCVVRFEDLRADSFETIRRILLFMDVEVSDDAIHRAVSGNTIERSREKEERAGPQDVKRYPSGGRFVGKGSVGTWQSKLTDDQVRQVEDRASDLLDRLGYGRVRPIAEEPRP
jgi:Sulfotransferase domain